jgi:serine/threonine protein kinase
MYNAVLNDSANSKSGTINYIDDEPNNSGDIANLNQIPEKKRPLFANEENYEYDSLDRLALQNFNFNSSQKMTQIDFKNLSIFDKLGTGCFASVYRGIYKIKSSGDSAKSQHEIPVAIKKLNMENMDESRKEIEKEAELMRSLNNPFIIKFIGMCFNYENSSIMIVLELAKLGPLHKYLRSHHEISMFKIVKICYQVSIAMSYLAEKKLIHRDLAARNVLLVSEDLAKVSDFGLSRKMNEFNCYETQAHGKWPLKWYPPDATLGKFDEKSDVWSFGVTCWEATSYGARPYQGIEISTLILSLQNGHRLGKPSKCPDEIYNLMLKCWHADKHQRPNFRQIKEEMKQIINDLYQVYLSYG